MVDLSAIPEAAWREAQRRAEVIRPLAEAERRPRQLIRAAAATLGLSERQTYALLHRCREGGGALTALLPGGSTGGRGKPRVPQASEATLLRTVEELYLTSQRLSAAKVAATVIGRCRAAQLPPPSASTVRRRLRALSLAERRRRGEAHPEAQPVHGPAPAVRFPLDLVQMDHTPVDLILVDPVDRAPIGRPYLTVAIDVYSRCIAGLHLSLEAPSATSVGLCLTHVAANKMPWLTAHGVEAAWPIAGKPHRIGVDNGSEFHSAAFERGCAQHGITIDWRPPGRPHFGGIVERVIGTLMTLVHALPGTTFSNVGQRGDYDSDKAACLTLQELERWFAVAVAKYYHLRPHEGLDGETPLHRHEAGMQALSAGGLNIPLPRDARAFLIDFLPVLHRSLQRDGITIDHITYFSSALRSWITARDRPEPLLVRRDPRDLSRVFVLDPKSEAYLEVPCRVLSRPAISLWEHRLARRRIRARRREAVNEDSLFAAVEEMRSIECEAVRLTRSARRDRTRRGTAPPNGEPGVVAAAPPTARPTEAGIPTPFDDFEQW